MGVHAQIHDPEPEQRPSVGSVQAGAGKFCMRSEIASGRSAAQQSAPSTRRAGQRVWVCAASRDEEATVAASRETADLILAAARPISCQCSSQPRSCSQRTGCEGRAGRTPLHLSCQHGPLSSIIFDAAAHPRPALAELARDADPSRAHADTMNAVWSSRGRMSEAARMEAGCLGLLRGTRHNSAGPQRSSS